MIVFLDIDGVMVPAAGWKVPENLEDGFAAFSPKAVDALRHVVSDDTQVVLTTSHRARFTPLKWKELFERRGIAINKLSFLQATPTFQKRKDELLNWFATHDEGSRSMFLIAKSKGAILEVWNE